MKNTLIAITLLMGASVLVSAEAKAQTKPSPSQMQAMLANATQLATCAATAGTQLTTLSKNLQTVSKQTSTAALTSAAFMAMTFMGSKAYKDLQKCMTMLETTFGISKPQV